MLRPQGRRRVPPMAPPPGCTSAVGAPISDFAPRFGNPMLCAPTQRTPLAPRFGNPTVHFRASSQRFPDEIQKIFRTNLKALVLTVPFLEQVFRSAQPNRASGTRSRSLVTLRKVTVRDERCLCFKFRIIEICSVLATPVCLVMDRVAKRPRGFAFLSYTGEEEARGAMERDAREGERCPDRRMLA